MIVKDIINILEEFAPLDYAEDFDNVGLLVGDYKNQVQGVLVSLDTLENVVEEAIAKKCNLIVSFHPIIFSGLKKITGKNYVERVVIKAIQNNIAIYSMHTALDNTNTGVNAKICEVLGLQNTKILIPQKGTIKKLTTYVPVAAAEKLKKALYDAGAGALGNYTNCSFSTTGIGQYKANEKANPTHGKIGKDHSEKELQIHITFLKSKEKSVLKALFNTHPYEEIAYEISTLENTNPTIGMGMTGELKKPIDEMDFLNLVKKQMKVSCIRHTKLQNKKVSKVAVLGGSGAFAINAAKQSGAQIFISADIKYHEFYQAEGKIVLADIGHYETEQFTKNLLVDYLTKKIPNFAIHLSESKTNPIQYL